MCMRRGRSFASHKTKKSAYPNIMDKTLSREEKDEENKNYIRKERVYGSTKRQFYVGDVDEDSIKASFDRGVLKVVVPKKEEISNKKKIEIEQKKVSC